MNHLEKYLGALAAVLVTALPSTSFAISNSGKIPILLYHTAGTACTYNGNGLTALESDLETLHANGFTVVPLFWVAEWVVGTRDGSTLPAKPIAITFDDGVDSDWVLGAWSGCSTMTSGYDVLTKFKAKYEGILPWYSPHASSFVIASPVARRYILDGYMRDTWWAAAQSSGVIEIYNHGADHDHTAITPQQPDNDLEGITVRVAGPGDTDFRRVDTIEEADAEVRVAAKYIHSKTGAWPDLFAYPIGQASSYMINTYFPNYGSAHGTFAAFCLLDTYATRASNRFCIPRFTYNSAWTSPATFVSQVLNGAP